MRDSRPRAPQRRVLRPSRRHDDRGAALVEMAIVAIFLFTMLFGIIDFGWMFTKNLDVRHGARETGRLAAVNFDDTSLVGSTQGQRIVNAACDRMDGDADTTVILDLNADESAVTVRVEQDFGGITGFFDTVMPDELTSEVTMRMEQTESFEDGDTAADAYVCGAG